MNSNNAQRVYKAIMLIVLTALITFILTSVMMKDSKSNTTVKYLASENSDLISKLDYYKSFIEKYYIGDIDEEKMQNSAIKGYFEGLGDEYSEYISKEDMKEYLEDVKGHYIGIGVYIANDVKTNKIVVLTPIKGSPAEEAGIKSGDIILKVDGIEYDGSQLIEASNKLKAEKSTKAQVQILRGENEIIDLEIERSEITLNSIETEIYQNDIGYIQISSFDDGTYKQFLENYENLKQKGIKSLIIDLRNNGGGIVDEAVNIADLFVEKDKTILITNAKTEKDKIVKAKNDKKIDEQVVILVNENTASSSEILAAALKENLEDVKIIGNKTFGKGIIQTVFTLKDGAGVKLTTEEYFSPNHNSINKVGISPDYSIDLPENETVYSVSYENDTQLQRAINYLKKND